MAVKGLQQHRPARKWRDPITTRGVRRRRVTSAGVVRGLECYNVTIATGRFRLKRWNVTFYHRRRKRVLYVERNRTTCRLVMYLRKVTKQHVAFGGFIRAKDVRIHGFVGIYPPGKFVTGSFWLTRITWDPALWSFSDCFCRLWFLRAGFEEGFSESTFWLFPSIQNSPGGQRGSDVICQ